MTTDKNTHTMALALFLQLLCGAAVPVLCNLCEPKWSVESLGPQTKHSLLTTGMAPALFLQLLCGAAVAPEVFVALSSSVAPVAQVPKMVCSNCQNWIDCEWLVWRGCDSWEHEWVPPGMHSFHFWQGSLFFFYCQRCRVMDPTLKGIYINANGYVSTDSDSESATQ